MKTLETARLLLTPWREEDAEALYALASDPDIGPMCGWEPHRSVEDSRRIIRDVFSAPEVCAILSRESGTLLGPSGFSRRRRCSRSCLPPASGSWVIGWAGPTGDTGSCRKRCRRCCGTASGS